ncbi:MAG: radical SAM protein [bacterium]
MKIVFVYPAFESLAIEYLSAIAKSKGHEVSMVFDPRLFDDSFVRMPSLARLFSTRNRVVRDVIEQKPDLIAFSVVTTDYGWFRKLGGALRSRTKAPIIAGNIHVTSVPEEVLKLDFVDAVVRGEGELAFADILDSIQDSGEINHEIQNLGMRENGAARINPLRPLIQNLDELPFPDKTLYEGTPMRVSDVYTIMAERGCPFTCSFCNNNLMKRLYGVKGYLRSRSVDNVIAELTRARETFAARRVNFYDEVFGVNKKWLEEFTEKYTARIGLPYIACTNPNNVTEEYAELLRVSGCRKVDLGVQTINEEKRASVYHRRETNDQVRFAVATLQKKGIIVAAENIANFPGETESDLTEMARFYNETRPDILKVFWLRYFPGTEIVDIAVEKGVLAAADVAKINAGEDAGSVTLGAAASRLHKKFYLLFVLSQVAPEKWIEHIINRRLYRFLPTSFFSRIAYTLARLLTRKDYDSEIMMHQHAGRYKFYLKRFFFPSK